MFEISGYTIKNKIGEGGSSEVYLAVNEENRQYAALKLLHEKYSGDPGMRKRLSREAEVIGSLDCPNIVKIFRFGTIKSRFYMILEYLSGNSLSDYQRFSMRDRLKYMIQVCSGVGYIHERGIVHRDLKPSNIMFGEDRIPRLVDFGISLFSEENYTRLTHTNMVMGTLSYMSPEQQTDPGSVDHRTDIYSLGAILYEIFTGKKPVGRFADPSVLIPDFDKRLEKCILSCLAHRPEDRYPQISMLSDALVELWQAGLFANGDDQIADDHFDDRIGYWLQVVQHGTSRQRIDARGQIVRNVRPDDFTTLINIGRSSGTDVRAALIPALAKLKKPEAYGFLAEQLGNPLLTRDACLALAAIGDPRAIEPMVKILKKKEVYSYGALVPLAILGEEKHLKFVVPFLKSDDYSDRAEAVKAFEMAASCKKYLKDLQKAMKTEADADLRNRLYSLVQNIEVS